MTTQNDTQDECQYEHQDEKQDDKLSIGLTTLANKKFTGERA